MNATPPPQKASFPRRRLLGRRSLNNPSGGNGSAKNGRCLLDDCLQLALNAGNATLPYSRYPSGKSLTRQRQ
jgi:hypothetical protein